MNKLKEEYIIFDKIQLVDWYFKDLRYKSPRKGMVSMYSKELRKYNMCCLSSEISYN